MVSLIKNYIDYLKDNPKGYWFKRKLYGWGWVPAKWQGWAVIAFFIVLILGIALFLGTKPEPSSEDLLLFFAGLVAIISALFLICYKKGERPCWQWGKHRELPESKNTCAQDFFVGRAIVIIIIAIILLAYYFLK